MGREKEGKAGGEQREKETEGERPRKRERVEGNRYHLLNFVVE